MIFFSQSDLAIRIAGACSVAPSGTSRKLIPASSETSLAEKLRPSTARAEKR
jgi:hypothetical protein